MKRKTTLILTILLAITITAFGHSLWHTSQAIKSLQRRDISTATNHAKNARWLPATLNAVVFGVQPDLNVWHKSLKTISNLETLFTTGQQYAHSSFSHTESSEQLANQFKTQLTTLSIDLKKIESSFKTSWFLRHVTQDQVLDEKIVSVTEVVDSMLYLLDGKHTYLVIFQNTQEIRATGGFIGTYAIATLNNGLLERFEVQDIYVPDGQFTGYVEAPAGVREYLSSGKGLRLPDANWHADFPTTARQLLSFFSLSDEQNIEGVIAVNLPVAEKLLGITGPLFLADYQTMVDQYNFASIARQDRDQFFPGSQQKKHFMSSFFNQLLATLGKTDSSQQSSLVSLFLDSAQTKDLLFFSQDKQTQNVFEKAKIDGSISIDPKTGFYFYSIESNVGINKANKNIDRAVSLKLSENSSIVTMVFTNHNTAPTKEYLQDLAPTEAKHLAYLNYQRVLVLPEYDIEKIVVDDQPVVTWDEELITVGPSTKLKQVGFLITVPEQKQAFVQLTLNHPPLQTPTIVQIDKQSGIPTPQYQIIYGKQDMQLRLHRNTVLPL